MRPRHRAAEYFLILEQVTLGKVNASMRPRHRAAEYGEIGGDSGVAVRRFNEAAA